MHNWPVVLASIENPTNKLKLNDNLNEAIKNLNTMYEMIVKMYWFDVQCEEFK